MHLILLCGITFGSCLSEVTVNAVAEKMGRKRKSTRQRMTHQVERAKKARKDEELRHRAKTRNKKKQHQLRQNETYNYEECGFRCAICDHDYHELFNFALNLECVRNFLCSRVVYCI